jgi:hypothetical protein
MNGSRKTNIPHYGWLLFIHKEEYYVVCRLMDETESQDQKDEGPCFLSYVEDKSKR